MKPLAYVVLAIMPAIYLCRLLASLAHQRGPGMTSDTFYNILWLVFWSGGLLFVALPQPLARWVAYGYVAAIGAQCVVFLFHFPAAMAGRR